MCETVSLSQLRADEQSFPHIEQSTGSQAVVCVLHANDLQRRSRRVELCICFCLELLKRGLIKLVWVDGHLQAADIVAKTLGVP